MVETRRSAFDFGHGELLDGVEADGAEPNGVGRRPGGDRLRKSFGVAANNRKSCGSPGAILCYIVRPGPD